MKKGLLEEERSTRRRNLNLFLKILLLLQPLCVRDENGLSMVG